MRANQLTTDDYSGKFRLILPYYYYFSSDYVLFSQFGFVGLFNCHTRQQDPFDREIRQQHFKRVRCFLNFISRFDGAINEKYKIYATFSYDDCYVYGGSEDGNVLAWDILDSSPKKKLKCFTERVSCVASHPYEDQIIISSFNEDKIKVLT